LAAAAKGAFFWQLVFLANLPLVGIALGIRRYDLFG
jgi:hypothetical protein